jgi:hypothetical protein
MIEFTDDRPPVTPEELDAAAGRLEAFGQPLPASYRAFLEERDGGVPVLDRFTYEQDGEERRGRVQVLLGVREARSPATDLLSTADDLQGRIPAGILPIGRDPGGNLICLDGRNGAVLFWDHEYEAEDEPDEANLHPIAADLQTFLDGLEGRPDEPLPEPPKKGLRRLFGG